MQIFIPEHQTAITHSHALRGNTSLVALRPNHKAKDPSATLLYNQSHERTRNNSDQICKLRAAPSTKLRESGTSNAVRHVLKIKLVWFFRIAVGVKRIAVC